MGDSRTAGQVLSPRSILINFIRLDDTIVQSGKIELIDQLKVYGEDVHKLMLESFPDGEGMVEFLRIIEIRSDREVREYLAYRDHVKSSRVPFVVLDEVRSSLAIRDLSIPTETSKRRDGIEAALKVAVASRRRWWMLDNALGLPYRENFSPDQMSAPLAEFIMENVDSVDAIITYVTSHEREPRNVDIDHLREYVDHVAPAVREGML
jgi:hypothetical protein